MEAIIFALDIFANHAATWRPRIGPPHSQSASSQPPSHYLYCHVTIHTSSHHMPAWICTATCHLVSGLYCHVSPCQWCHVAPHFAKFTCFINTTERDNFLIRSPFEVKRTSLESSRRALRSGTSFAEIGGLQKFCLLGSSWIKSIHVHHITKTGHQIRKKEERFKCLYVNGNRLFFKIMGRVIS